MNKQLHTLFHDLTPTNEQVTHIYDTIQQRQPAPSVVKKRNVLPLLVAVIAVLITTVAAVSVVTLSHDSLHFLSQFSSKEQDYWESGAFVVNQSITCDSGSVVLKEVLGDDATTLIFLDFIAPEGQVLDKAMYDFDWRDVSIKYSTLMYGFDPIQDPDPTDNVVPFVFSITTEGTLAGTRIQLTLGDCMGADDWDTLKGDTHDHVTVFDGVWAFDFDADFKTFATTYKPKVDIAYEGTEISWDRVSVSPISLRIWASFDVDDRAIIGTLAEQLRIFTVHYQDGTVRQVDGASGTIDYITGDILSTLDYTQLDLDQPITAVTYLGKTYDFQT